MTAPADTDSKVVPPRLAILGPTASGKSAVALELVSLLAARGRDVELVSIDAMQVYRGMDIGTAKPTIEERRRVPHHLIDLVDPGHDYSLAEFRDSATRVIEEIEGRGGTAVLVGGTGLYVRAIVDRLEIPGVWPGIRRRLEEEAERLGTEVLHARLRESDPVAAAKMEPSNTRRVVRALEVVEGSGRPFSSFGPGLDTYPKTAVIQVALRWSRDALARRIEERVDRMFEAGLVDEVRSLVSRGLSRTAAQALGYKEIIGHLEGRTSLVEARNEIVLRTRQFAVRQERWFRRDPRVRWFDVGSDPVSEVAPRLLPLLP